MPVAAPKPCKTCGVVVRDGSTRCDLHKVREGTFSDRRRGSRHERGYGTQWDKSRERIMQRDCQLCQSCLRRGYVVIAYAVDHKVPKAEGGTDDDDNLEAICRPCHVEKTSQENQRARLRVGGGQKSGAK